MSGPHPLNRHLFIVDNYHLLRSLEANSIDLICTDPPFAKNDTFVDNPKPPLTDVEIQKELDTIRSWGIHNPREAEQANIMWPIGTATARFKDIWSWESDVHEQWMEDIRYKYPGVLHIIETTRHAHSEGTAAYLAYIAVRLIECHRVLKSTGSLYLHCDQTANSYLRLLLDAIFENHNMCNEIIWAYSTGGASKSRFARKHDTIFYYAKDLEEAVFNTPRAPYTSAMSRDPKHSHKFHPEGKIMLDWWDDIAPLNPQAKERTGYPTQKPVALAERILQASSNPEDVVFDPFAGCAYVPVAAERLGRQWLACDISPRALTMLRRQFKKFAYSLDGEIPEGEMISVADVTVRGPRELPDRIVIEEDAPSIKPLPPRKYKTRASIFSRDEMLEHLLRLSGWRAWCCGFANWKIGHFGKPVIEHTTRNFELDHIDPRSMHGRHEIDNRAPLCPHHNDSKGDRRIHLEDLREEIVQAGELTVPSMEDLVDLAWAREQTLEHLATRKHGSATPSIR